jgi:hypothetical protein
VSIQQFLVAVKAGWLSDGVQIGFLNGSIGMLSGRRGRAQHVRCSSPNSGPPTDDNDVTKCPSIRLTKRLIFAFLDSQSIQGSATKKSEESEELRGPHLHARKPLYSHKPATTQLHRTLS